MTLLENISDGKMGVALLILEKIEVTQLLQQTWNVKSIYTRIVFCRDETYLFLNATFQNVYFSYFYLGWFLNSSQTLQISPNVTKLTWRAYVAQESWHELAFQTTQCL